MSIFSHRWMGLRGAGAKKGGGFALLEGLDLGWKEEI